MMIMHSVSNHHASATKMGAKWLLLCLAFVWLVGCMGLGKTKSARDPFASTKFSCGEDIPASRTPSPPQSARAVKDY
jgi:hypothetical protein